MIPLIISRKRRWSRQHVNKAGNERNVDEVVEIGKRHPRRQRRGNNALQHHAELESEKPLIDRDQSLVAIRGDHQQSRITPEHVVHQQDDQEREPIADDFPKRADKIEWAFTARPHRPALTATK